MRHRGSVLVVLLSASLPLGCATVQPRGGFSDVEKLVADRVPERIAWNQNSEEDAEAERAVRSLLEQELDENSAVQIALLNNQDLQATYEELGIAQADLVQAGLLKNPIWGIERRFPQKAMEIDAFQDFMSIVTIPLRKRIAREAFAAAKLRVAEAVWRLSSEVRSAVYALRGSYQLLDMRQSVRAAVEASTVAARQLRAAGNTTELALRQEELALTQAKLDQSTAEAQVERDTEHLALLMGLWGTEMTWRIGRKLPDLPAAEPSWEGLESTAVAQRLDLAAAREDIIVQAESLGLTNALRLVPSAEVGFHYEREPDGFASTGPSFFFGIPIFDQGQASMARGRSALRQLQRRFSARAIEARSEVRAAYYKTTWARQRTEFYKHTVLPLRADLLREASLHYNAMTLGLFTFIQARQSQIDAGREYLESLRDYWLGRVELERAIGGRIRESDGEQAVAPGERSAPPADGPSAAAAQAAADHNH